MWGAGSNFQFEKAIKSERPRPLTGPVQFTLLLVVPLTGRNEVEFEVEDLKPYQSIVRGVIKDLGFVIGGKDASETLEEQQRSRVLHLRREAKTRVWDTEREVGEGLHQALRCVLPLPQIPNRSHELPQGPSLLQRVHSPVPLVSEERHSKVPIRCPFLFCASNCRVYDSYSC